MESKKEIVVLSGAGHKGIVKIKGTTGAENTVKGSCNLDFRPSNATLYLVGDNIAKIGLHDTNTEFEVPFCAKSDFGCVVRSSSLTMFGGNIPNGKILKRIDEFQKQNALKATAETCANKQAQNAKPVAQVNEQTGDKITIGATLKDLNLDEWTKYDGNNFYYAVKPQIDELFVRYPEEKILNDAVASSKWAHVQTGEDYYVVGVLFNDDEPSFICYGREEIVLNDNEDVLTQICRHYMKTCQCPRYMEHEKVEDRRQYVKKLVEEYHADGVVYEQLKFCEYWGYERALASYIMINEFGIPAIAIDRQYTASASGQLRTRIQAFVESLEIKHIQKAKAEKASK